MAYESFNFTWTLGDLPPSRAVETTVWAIKRLAEKDSKSHEIRLLALDLVRDELSYDRQAEVGAIHRFVRDEVRYVRDVVGAETVQSPRLTLRLGQGDCDDKTGLVASLLMAVGYPVRYVVASTNPRHPGVPSHIYPETDLRGTWVAVETIIPGAPLGYKPQSYGRPRVFK